MGYYVVLCAREKLILLINGLYLGADIWEFAFLNLVREFLIYILYIEIFQPNELNQLKKLKDFK